MFRITFQTRGVSEGAAELISPSSVFPEEEAPHLSSVERVAQTPARNLPSLRAFAEKAEREPVPFSPTDRAQWIRCPTRHGFQLKSQGTRD